jgi:hypothetical protein
MSTTQYRKKPVVIEAVQIEKRMDLTAPAWWAEAIQSNAVIVHGMGKFTRDQPWVEISTLEGVMRGDAGDWIIKGVKGEFYPCKPDIFAATYESAALDPSDAVGAPKQVNAPDIILTGAQLLEALEFIAPDRATDPEQLESEVAIAYGEGHGGRNTYVWCADYPEEGSFVCDGKSVTAERAADSSDDQEWDRRAEALTEAAGLGGGRINPNATSIMDLFTEPSEQREPVDDVLAIVASYGPYGRDINEGLRFQIVLADEVKRLRALFAWRSPDEKPESRSPHHSVQVLGVIDDPGLCLDEEKPFVDIVAYWPVLDKWTCTYQAKAGEAADDFPVKVAAWMPLLKAPSRPITRADGAAGPQHDEIAAEYIERNATIYDCCGGGCANASLIEETQNELVRLNAIINSPQSGDFLRAVSIEAEHQRQRWGSKHDAGKEPVDWFWLIGYLAGKALNAAKADDHEKFEHHIITTAAALANWHMQVFGVCDMRPGIGRAAVETEAP